MVSSARPPLTAPASSASQPNESVDAGSEVRHWSAEINGVYPHVEKQSSSSTASRSCGSHGTARWPPSPSTSAAVALIDHLRLTRSDLHFRQGNKLQGMKHPCRFCYVNNQECSLEGVSGLLVFPGSVSALAYLGRKESIKEAISYMKVDIISSLRSRLDIIQADDDSASNDVENSPSQKSTQVIFHELREPYSFSFPRRILIPWLAGPYICDHLQQSETTKDAMERCKEVISLETGVENSLILEPEVAAASATLESFWDVVPGALPRARAGPSLKDGHSEQANGSRRTQGISFSILSALFVLLVALLVGFMFAFPANSKLTNCDT